MINSNQFGHDEFSAALFGRAEDLTYYKNAQIDKDGNISLNAIVLENTIALPQMVTPIFISPGINLESIIDAQNSSRTIIGLVPDVDGQFRDLAIEIAVGQLLELPDGNYSALIQGRRRVRVQETIQSEPFLKIKARVAEKVRNYKTSELKALSKNAKTLFEQVVQLDRTIPDEVYLYALNISDPGLLADMIATALSPERKQRIKIIDLIDRRERLVYINHLLAEELEVLILEDEIHSKVQNEINRNQRESYLREQARAIQTELGDGDIWEQEITEYRKKLESLNAPAHVMETVETEIKRLSLNPSFAPETGIIRNYIEWLLNLPWNIHSKDNLSILHAEKILNKNHYGLKKAKERILEYLAVKNLKPGAVQPILCFIGPPGTGKTTLGKSIAEALGKKFVRLSLGGVKDEAEIRGHRRTYIGAMPGRIIQSIRRTAFANPLFMLDEIDKLGNDFRGDPSSSLMEVLDQEQNHAFSDHFIEIPFDLSDVFFITTANATDGIPSALLDRMEIIEFPSYLEEEKIKIAKKFLIPKQIISNGLETGEIRFEEQAIQKIIREYTYEAGVRNLEREIGKICRKIAKLKSQKKKYPDLISEKPVQKFLGAPQFSQFKIDKLEGIGVSTAVAWTENGGEIMPVEVVVVEGKGNLQITGKIGEIMQESAQAALSYIKSRAKDFNIEEEYFEKVDIHLHIPEGAVEKDGPSAGVTICIAMLSALTRRKVHLDIGMTGEITLGGSILQVGGLREKVYAAQRAGLKQLIIPRKNKNDLVELPKKIRDDLKIVLTEKIDQVIRIALYPS